MSSLNIISENNNVFEPSASCALSGVFLGANSFKNSSLFVHASSGCGFAMRYGLGQHWKSFMVCPVSSMCDDNIIFGSKKLLSDSLEKFLKIHDSEVVFVGTGCSASIIGEDYISVTEHFSKKYNKPIVFIDSGGLTGDLVRGYDVFLTNVTKYFSDAHIEYDFSESIDICGIIPMYDIFWRGNISELKRLFSILDIKINSFYTGDVGFNEIQKIYYSNLVVSINYLVGKRTLSLLKNKFDVSVEQHSYYPIGINNTVRFLESICSKLGKNDMYKEIILHEKNIAQKTIKRGFDFSKVMFSSGRFALIGDATKIIPMTDFLLNELGMQCVMIAFTNKVSENILLDLETVLKNGCLNLQNIVVLNGEDNHFIRKMLNELQPNVVFGRSIDRTLNDKKVVHVTWHFPASDNFLVYDRPIIGFKGVTSIVDYIVNGFCKIWY